MQDLPAEVQKTFSGASDPGGIPKHSFRMNRLRLDKQGARGAMLEINSYANSKP
jgi:hypothetical protein